MQSSAQQIIDTRSIELAAEARQIAKDARDQCRGEYESLRDEFRSHRAETSSRFTLQDADRTRMHGENSTKFDRLFRSQYIAIGVGMAAAAGLSAMSPMIQRLLHP